MIPYRVAIIGMGYVGLPLAIESGKHFHTVGYDIDSQRISQLKQGLDTTQEVSAEDMQEAQDLHFTIQAKDMSICNFFVITTPTPLDEANKPDLSYVLNASKAVGEYLKKGDIVVYESTVYPGCTEEVCVPVLEKTSSLLFNKDFFCGYSPERINPGDKTRRLRDIKKITSGSNPATSRRVDHFYRQLITAGTHSTSSIRAAEAAKAIENAQRDLNIAFVNELAIIFHKMQLDTQEVLEAASTKWNFLSFKPGLVGGHCIGIDPYYLTYKAESLGYHAQIILSGRRLNDDMGLYIAVRMIKLLSKKNLPIVHAHVLILGLTFKENCPDLRNSRVFDIIKELRSYRVHVHLYDPWVSSEEAKAHCGLSIEKTPYEISYDGILVAVAHTDFENIDWQRLKGKPSVLFDVKGIVPREYADERL